MGRHQECAGSPGDYRPDATSPRCLVLVLLPLDSPCLDRCFDLALARAQATAAGLHVDERDRLHLTLCGQAIEDEVVDRIEERAAVARRIAEPHTHGRDLLQDLPDVHVDRLLPRTVARAASLLPQCAGASLEGLPPHLLRV